MLVFCSKAYKMIGLQNCYPNVTLAKLAVMAMNIYGTSTSSIATITNLGTIVGKYTQHIFINVGKFVSSME